MESRSGRLSLRTRIWGAAEAFGSRLPPPDRFLIPNCLWYSAALSPLVGPLAVRLAPPVAAAVAAVAVLGVDDDDDGVDVAGWGVGAALASCIAVAPSEGKPAELARLDSPSPICSRARSSAATARPAALSSATVDRLESISFRAEGNCAEGSTESSSTTYFLSASTKLKPNDRKTPSIPSIPANASRILRFPSGMRRKRISPGRRRMFSTIRRRTASARSN
mmetsp:Transcript_27916/g.67842  ORF Transcript_27916/g.67842 Transcript_27916/m.67842 type:complete len:222 (+) Transcript_27916:977-1642(+)